MRNKRTESERALPGWCVDIINYVAGAHGFTLDKLSDGPKLSRMAKAARTEAVFIVRSLGGGLPSFPDLARYFGRDHSSLVVADNELRSRMLVDAPRARRIKLLRNACEELRNKTINTNQGDTNEANC